MTVVKSSFPPSPNDLYETEEWATQVAINHLKILGFWRNGTVWEPAAGNHKMVGPLMSAGAKDVLTSDIHTYTKPHNFMFDFLSDDTPAIEGEFDIVGNPPYGAGNHVARRFAEKALNRCEGYVALLLTAKFDFGSTRLSLFRDCPRFAAQVALVDRISWANNDRTGTEDHAWYIWGPRSFETDKKLKFYGHNPAKANR